MKTLKVYVVSKCNSKCANIRCLDFIDEWIININSFSDVMRSHVWKNYNADSQRGLCM